jgi:bacillithiol biosynthesis deacetylase BshB1
MSTALKLDVLAFGAHPDDVELGCAGTLLVESMRGKKTGIIDLTSGELGTRGNAALRAEESSQAAEILGLSARENLGLADGFFRIDESSQRKVIQAIRKYQPDIILCNAPSDRHPDHGRAATLVSESAFLSGLSKIETEEEGKSQNAWRPRYVFHYVQDRYLQPDFLVDITNCFDKKMESIKAFESQFYQEGITGPQTYISTPGFMENIVNRLKLFGKIIGVEYAEGFLTEKKIGIRNFDALIQNQT